MNSESSTAAVPAANPSRGLALLALVLLAPAPSVGVYVGFVAGEGTLGTILWMAAKVWLFGLPAAWRLWIDRRPLSLSPARRGGFGMAILLGALMCAAIAAVYLLGARNAIDPQVMRGKLESFGLLEPRVYLGAALYWICVNSVLEEYVYRWFFFEKLETLAGGKVAVLGSAAIFVVHHAIALNAFMPLWITVLSSLGIFIGGAIWSWLYLRYRSIWVPYVSHAMVDIAIFVIGAQILFG